ncbi:umbelliferone 6-dimethylallyltransferase, chloroplastic isoform X1 [Daucus carota subsp. sativus]|uniref:umbelliferone 6-dimethylallyltransferase, chloroplastic isoform X1 n=1 Tax=Daucus carota subsp. sativus TaxID=79200 RepID=UPI0007F02F3A|nr:PREDICTED: homogentisate phytyltransferase 1, chloroplastic-like isoform X1 [Daucus carota subsp. sativus]
MKQRKRVAVLFGNNSRAYFRNLLIHIFHPDGGKVVQPKDDKKEKRKRSLWEQWDAFYRFCRMYTVTGMVIGVSSVSVLPLTSVGDLSPAFFVGLLQALIPFVFVNLYVVGLDQLVDFGMDKLNKPDSPLATGEYSMRQGKAVVSAFAFTCLGMGIMFQSPPLFIGVLVYFLLGTAYSIQLPLLRWKENPFLDALCIVGGHGFTIQPAVFYHIQHVLGKPLAFTKSVAFATIFFSFFSVGIALFKDIPVFEGDRTSGNRTFCVRHGKKKVFSLCVSILLIAYGFAVVIGASSSFLVCKIVSVIGHSTLAYILFIQAKSLNLNDDVATESFYMFLWKLFSAEYVLIHFMH